MFDWRCRRIRKLKGDQEKSASRDEDEEEGRWVNWTATIQSAIREWQRDIPWNNNMRGTNLQHRTDEEEKVLLDERMSQRNLRKIFFLFLMSRGFFVVPSLPSLLLRRSIVFSLLCTLWLAWYSERWLQVINLVNFPHFQTVTGMSKVSLKKINFSSLLHVLLLLSVGVAVELLSPWVYVVKVTWLINTH